MDSLAKHLPFLLQKLLIRELIGLAKAFAASQIYEIVFTPYSITVLHFDSEDYMAPAALRIAFGLPIGSTALSFADLKQDQRLLEILNSDGGQILEAGQLYL